MQIIWKDSYGATWKIESDKLNVTLTRQPKGKKVFQIIGYMRDLTGVVEWMERNGYHDCVGTAREAEAAWRTMTDNFRAALLDCLKTQGGVPHPTDLIGARTRPAPRPVPQASPPPAPKKKAKKRVRL